MSADILNLRLARKRRERQAREEEAARNRLVHGESKAARQERRLGAAKAARDLEAHRRETGAPASADGSGLREDGS
jgi:Domain of unknown function (DUF4169)